MKIFYAEAHTEVTVPLVCGEVFLIHTMPAPFGSTVMYQGQDQPIGKLAWDHLTVTDAGDLG